MIRSILVASSVLVALAFAAGCSDTITTEAKGGTTSPDTNTAKVGSAAELCADLCSREVACDPKTDADTCKATCVNENSVYASKISADYAGKLSTCISEISCKELDSSSSLEACHDEARASLSPSPKVTAFCDDYAKSETKCDSKLDKASCLDNYKIYSDAAIADAEKCFDKACADVGSCISAAFGGTSSTSTPTPTPTSTPTSNPPPATDAGACTMDISYNTASCTTCMQGSCCQQTNACAESADCGDYVSCLDSYSQSTCDSIYPTGSSLFGALARCMASSCPSSC